MSDEESADPNPKPAASGWVVSDRPSGEPHRFAGTVAMILIGLPLMAVLAYGTLHIWSAAASDCQVFEAGDRFGVVFILFFRSRPSRCGSATPCPSSSSAGDHCGSG